MRIPWLRRMFSSVLFKAVGLESMFSSAGGAPTSTKRPRKPPHNATNFADSESTKIPRKLAKSELSGPVSRDIAILLLAMSHTSEKLEKAGTVDFKKHPARKVETGSRQCGPKVPDRFAFPGARNTRICNISRFRKIFQLFLGTKF